MCGPNPKKPQNFEECTGKFWKRRKMLKMYRENFRNAKFWKTYLQRTPHTSHGKVVPVGFCRKKTCCRPEKILQLCPRVQNNRMRGLASTARYKGHCSRGRQRRRGEGGNVVHAFFRARSALVARLRLSSLPLLFCLCRGRVTSVFRSVSFPTKSDRDHFSIRSVRGPSSQNAKFWITYRGMF